MHAQKEKIKSLMIELGLAPAVLQLFDGMNTDPKIHNYLGSSYTPPYAIIELPLEQQANYLVDKYKPLLAINNSTIFAYNPSLNSFTSYSIEFFQEQILRQTSWDGLFISKIVMWCELEWPHEDILYLGNALGLQHTEMIVEEFLKASNGKGFGTIQALHEWEEQMLELLANEA